MPGTDPMKPADSVKFTYEDLASFAADGRRHEIIDGEHYVSPSPGTTHQAVSGNLYAALWNHLKAHPIGAIFAAPFDVVLSDLDVLQPDLVYISRERARVLTELHVRGAPDLVVEIVSPGTRKTDEVTKRKVYERYGVQEYWVVDPELSAIKAYQRHIDGSARASELTAERDDVLTTPLLPGLTLRLTEVFAALL